MHLYPWLPPCSSHPCSPLSLSCAQLDLGYNELGPEGAGALAPAIAVCASITHIGEGGLDLRNNLLGGEGWGAIFAGVCSSEVSKIASINASGEDIGPKGAKLIAEALRTSVNASVTECNVRGNSLDAESATLLAKVAREKRIMLFGIKHDQTEANFQYVGLGPEEAILIASDLSVSASVTSVRSPAHRTPPICSPLSLN